MFPPLARWALRPAVALLSAIVVASALPVAPAATSEPHQPVVIPALTTPPTEENFFGVYAKDIREAGLRGAASDSGARFVRMSMEWRLVQPTIAEAMAGQFRWDDLDAKILAVNAAGMTPLLGVGDAPLWATTPGPQCGPFNRASDQPTVPGYQGGLHYYRVWLDAAVRRYSQAPYHVKFWQIFNEPDRRYIPGSGADSTCFGDVGPWLGGPGNVDNPRAYAAILAASYETIKNADQSATVVFGAMAFDGCFETHPRLGGPLFNCTFLQRVLEAGGGPFFDMVSYNSFLEYRVQGFQQETVFFPDGATERRVIPWERYATGLLGKAEGVRRVIENFNRINGTNFVKPIVIAETGMNHDWPESDTRTPRLTDRDLARIVPPSLTWAMVDRAQSRAQNRGGIEMVIWFTLADPRDDAYPGAPSDRWGLYDSNGQRQDGARAYRYFLSQMLGARFLRDLSEPTFGGFAGRRCTEQSAATFFAFRCNTLQHYVFQVADHLPERGMERHILWLNDPQIRSGRAIDPRQPDLLARRTVTASNVLTVTDLFGTVLHSAAPSGPKLPMVGNQVLLPVSDDAIFVTVRPNQVPQGGSGSVSTGGGVEGGRVVTKTITAPNNVFPNGQSGVINTYDAGNQQPPPPGLQNRVGGAIRIEAVLLDGSVVTQFVNPVTLSTTIAYNDLLSQFGVTPSEISYFRFVPGGVLPAGARGVQTAAGSWVRVPTTYNPATGQLVAQITQPGVYSLFAAESGRMYVPGMWRNLPMR